MRTVGKIINKDEIKQIIYEYVNNQYEFQDNYETPKQFQFLMKWWVKFLCYFFFFLFFIPVLWYRDKWEDYEEYMQNLVNVSISMDDYNAILKKTKLFNGIYITDDKATNPMLVEMRNSAIESFPEDCIIDEEVWSHIYTIDISRKCKITTQHVQIDYHYYIYDKNTTSSKQVREKYYATWSKSLAVINTNAFINEDDFNLNINTLTIGEEITLENKKFNQMNLIYTNNKIKTCMLLTMLYQEMAVNNGFNIQMSMCDNEIYAYDHKFKSVYTTEWFEFSLSDIEKGKEHMQRIIYAIFEYNINDLIDAFEPYLVLPVWK